MPGTEGQTKKNIKIWKATSDSNSGVMVTERAAFLIGNRANFVAADANGVTIVGKSISLATTSDQIRNGGLFVEMNDFVKLIPTTLVTPMPTQVPFPPLGLLSGILKDLPFFLAMLG